MCYKYHNIHLKRNASSSFSATTQYLHMKNKKRKRGPQGHPRAPHRDPQDHPRAPNTPPRDHPRAAETTQEPLSSFPFIFLSKALAKSLFHPGPSSCILPAATFRRAGGGGPPWGVTIILHVYNDFQNQNTCPNIFNHNNTHLLIFTTKKEAFPKICNKNTHMGAH